MDLIAFTKKNMYIKKNMYFKSFKYPNIIFLDYNKTTKIVILGFNV